MKEEFIKYEMRSRLEDAGICDLKRNFVGDNENPLDDFGEEGHWVMENVIAGDLRSLSDMRETDETLVFQYTVLVPVGTGTALLSSLAARIAAEFDPADPMKSGIMGDGCHATVTRVSASGGYSVVEGRWCAKTVGVTVRASGTPPLA